MTDVFISYSRHDMEFAKHLLGKLTGEKRHVWADWERIPLSATWWEEIKAGIEAADNFVFVVSPASLASHVCIDEFNHAYNLNKRIIPIVYALPESSTVPHIVGEFNWIYFNNPNSFDVAFGQLLETLDTDLSHVREHTRLLTLALEWEQRGLHPDFLLRGVLLKEAQEWLKKNGHLNPTPTELQINYIATSQRAGESFQNRLKGHLNNLPQRIGMGKKKMFISYRRADSQFITDRIYDRLHRHFRKEDIFIDIASIDLGVNFADVIRRSLTECVATMIVIGPQWTSISDAESGRRRLDNPNDLVRLEVEIALNNPAIRVIPLLVAGAAMPQVQDLPAPLRKLVQKNGTVIRHGRDFHKDMDDVINQLRKAQRNTH